MSMTVHQWQSTLQVKCSVIMDACIDMVAHMDTLGDTTDIETTDIDELSAVTTVRMQKLSQKLESLFEESAAFGG